MFQPNNNIHSITTHNALNFHLPFPRISTEYCGAALWNCLPDSVKNFKSLEQFKFIIKKFMFKRINRRN